MPVMPRRRILQELSRLTTDGALRLLVNSLVTGLGLLPLYAYTWRPEVAETHRRDRIALTMILVVIVWWNFLVGHVVNNIRGLP